MTFAKAKERLIAFAGDDSGATAIEYALIAGSIMVAIVAIVNVIGGNVAGSFQDVADGFN